MSGGQAFVLIRDGQSRYYADKWAGSLLFRELLWGPDALEKWTVQFTEFDDDEELFEVCNAGFVLNFDQQRLSFFDDCDHFKTPRVRAAYQRLLAAAWPGYTFTFLNQSASELAKAVSSNNDGLTNSPLDSSSRPATVREAAGFDTGLTEGEEFAGEPNVEREYEVDDNRAWITIIDEKRAVRHRYLEQVSRDILQARADCVKVLARLTTRDIPAESSVIEGVWIDISRRSIGLWGSSLGRELAEAQRHWRGWTLTWTEQGYDEQCRVSGPPGLPMNDAEAIALFLPIVLSTKQLNPAGIARGLGGSLKKTAIKATGCLVLVMCFPVLIFGLVTGNWRGMGITIGIIVAIVLIAFKLIERKIKRSALGKISSGVGGSENASVVAGPILEADRRQELERLLKAAGLPKLADIEPLCVDDAINLLGLA